MTTPNALTDRFPQTATAAEVEQSMNGENIIPNGLPSRLTLPLDNGEAAGDLFAARLDGDDVVITLTMGTFFYVDMDDEEFEYEFEERNFMLASNTIVGIHEEA